MCLEIFLQEGLDRKTKRAHNVHTHIVLQLWQQHYTKEMKWVQNQVIRRAWRFFNPNE